MANFLEVITYASFGGIIPCLFWLIFWLREDEKRHEPAQLILACFIAGMIMTLLVFPFQFLVTLIFSEGSLTTITAWSFIEEIGKFIAFYLVALRNPRIHAPIDLVIYMIAVALGFAALENTLYLIAPLSQGDALTSIITGNLRFIGATLLHTLASAIIGVFMAFALYKSERIKEEFALIGILCAGVLHTLFNFFILNGSGTKILLVFTTIWFLIMALIIVLEKVKTISIKNT